MKLNELFNLFEDGCCFDTSDNVYDAVVTWDWVTEDEMEDEYYDNFVKTLAEKVEVIKTVGKTHPVIIVGYSDLINNNLELFWDFAIDNWREEKLIDDDDNLVYEFIEEFHRLVAGNGSERVNKMYYELLLKCK